MNLLGLRIASKLTSKLASEQPKSEQPKPDANAHGNLLQKRREKKHKHELN